MAYDTRCLTLVAFKTGDQAGHVTEIENGFAMELVFIVAILAPCALVALLILVTVARPNAAPALAIVLAAITEPLRTLTHWFDNLSNRP